MGRLVKIFGAVGFLFSAATNTLILGMITAIYALFTYPISILLRGVAWIKLFRESGDKYYMATGIATLILGMLVFTMFLPSSDTLGIWGDRDGLETLAIPIFIWTIYSLFELRAYYRLRIYTRMFTIAQVSIVGIIIVLMIVFGMPDTRAETLVYGVPPLLLSSITAAAGFLKLDLEKDIGESGES